MNINASSFYTANSKSYSAQAIAVQDKRTSWYSNNLKQPNATLSNQQQSEVQALKVEDQQVRNHEQAHLSAAGGFATSGANYDFTTGPDGKLYATGGDVSIDTSPVANDPEATIRKAETIRRAALAPAAPSSQDYKVAAQASQMANKARMELLQSQQVTSQSGSKLNIRV